MFNGLMKSKFYTKCKSDIKLTSNRIEIIKKKRNAMQKYLRNDIADLLRNGLDSNAYGRADGLVAEMTKTSCYDFVHQCCEDILKNLSAMDKQMECPDECKEAVASLMFASARFADLPELRHLRGIFSERYGRAMDYYVNKQFADKLKSSVPSKDTKVQLLQEIAAESGLEWDSKTLENELYQKMFSRKPDGNEYSSNNSLDSSVQKKCGEDIAKESQNGREEFDHRAPSNTVSPISEIQMDITGRRTKITEAASLRNEKEEEEQEDNTKPLHYKSIPPPYTKPESNKPNPADASKSVRTGKSLSSPSGSCESENEKEKLKNKEKEKAAAQGRRILKFLDRGHEDEEEKMMDRLLKYYSRRRGGARKKGEEEAGPCGSRVREAPGRLASLPVESMSPKETPKHTRAASFQPDNGHVHPKMPDYDEFVARLAELRGKKTD